MPIPAPGVGRRRCTVVGATLWIVAGLGYLALEAGAAAGRPRYSYARNYISDLGVTSRDGAAGRPDFLAAALMNAAFCVQGAMFLAAAILVVIGLRGRRPGLFLGFAALNAAGNILVAIVPGGVATDPGGGGWLHVAGAASAIVGGNAAVLAGSRLVRDAGGAQWYRTASVAAGVLGLLCLLMLRVDSSPGDDAGEARARGGTGPSNTGDDAGEARARGGTGPSNPASAFEILPNGVWERGSVYSIIGWQLLTGCCLLAWSFDMRD
jgi:hypothetical membrane protein